MLQFIVDHRKFLLNKDYGRMGLIVMPYIVFFEFLAPIIEFVGFLFFLFLLLTNQVNFETFWMMLLYAYLIGLAVSIVTVSNDLVLGKLYRNFWEYLKLVFFAALEAFLYHPLVVFFTLKGYVQYITKKDFKWGQMTRQGYSPNKNPNTAT